MTTSSSGESPRVCVFDDSALPDAVAIWMADMIREAIDARGRADIALAGGSTPRRICEALASERHRTSIDWTRVHIYFGDERAVAPTHPDSNFRMAYDARLGSVPVPASQVYRVEAERGSPSLTAE